MKLEVPSLLITDDDHDFRETLRCVFESRFRTLVASDGLEALEILRHQEVHLMLLDMHMPRLTGLETIRQVRQLKWRLPCILLSARVDETLIHEATLAEAFSVLSKPVSREKLTNTVADALRRVYNWEPEPPRAPDDASKRPR